MRTTRWLVLSLLACGALAFGCADASDEEITEPSDDSATDDVTTPTPVPCEELDTSTPEGALAAYSCLREANRIDVQVNRRGKPDTIDIQIK